MALSLPDDLPEMSGANSRALSANLNKNPVRANRAGFLFMLELAATVFMGGQHMTDNIENLILEHLRALRADVSSIKADVRDLKLRMSSMENYMASFHLEIARHGSKFDEVDARIDRIERRLELRDNA